MQLSIPYNTIIKRSARRTALFYLVGRRLPSSRLPGVRSVGSYLFCRGGCGGVLRKERKHILKTFKIGVIVKDMNPINECFKGIIKKYAEEKPDKCIVKVKHTKHRG